MLITSRLIPIIAVVISILIGVLFYYSTSKADKEDKKKLINEVIEYLIHFVLFIWLAKIIINIQTFIKDPVAILAYPGNQKAFYIAILLLFINIFYTVRKGKLLLKPFISAFVPIIIFAMFAHEFMNMVLFDRSLSWTYLMLTLLLSIFYLTFYERIIIEKLIAYLFFLWSVGTSILTFYLPFVAMFGFRLSFTIQVGFSVISIFLVFFLNMKQKTKG